MNLEILCSLKNQLTKNKTKQNQLTDFYIICGSLSSYSEKLTKVYVALAH